jgi:lysozyme family protein
VKPDAAEVGPQAEARARQLDQRAKIAFGVALICGLFGAETAVAHHSMPHPASPFIWAGLGTVAAVALVLGLRWQRQARR